jgi:WD40 repeat protein
MPEGKFKRKIRELIDEVTRQGDQSIPPLLMQVVEQLCVAMRASGAVIALRDLEGLRCVASTGLAPARGTRLSLDLDSDFATACPTIGELVPCPWATTVPIQVQGTAIGVIEVYSSQSSTILSNDIAALKQTADVLAPILVAASVEGVPIFAGLESRLFKEQLAQSSVAAGWFPSGPLLNPSEPFTDSNSFLSALERAPIFSNSSQATLSGFEEFARRWTTARAWITGWARPGVFQRFAQSTVARRWLVIATPVLFLALLFSFATTRRPPTNTSSAPSAVPFGPDWQKPEKSRTSTKVNSQPKVEAAGARNSDDPSPPRIVVSPASPRSSWAEREKLATAGSPALSTSPEESREGTLSNSNALPPTGPDAIVRYSKSPVVARHSGNKFTNSPPPPPAIEGSGLEAFEPPTDTARTAIPPIKPPIPLLTPSPDFVRDRTLKGHSGWVTGVAFSSDGRRLASGSWDQTVKFWDVPTGQELSTVGTKLKEVQALAFRPDGRWLATENSNYTVTFWDTGTGREIRRLPSDRPPVAFSTNWVYSIAFSPDGRWLASAVDDKTIRLWDVNTGRAVRDLTSLRRSVSYAAFSPDGRWLASGDGDKSIRIWDVFTGQEVRTLHGHRKPIYAVAFSPDGRWLASASADKNIKLWDVASGREIHTLTGHGSLVSSLAFNPDGRWLASGSWDKTIKVWDVESGEEVQSLGGGHDHSVYTVAFDSRGRWLASGSEDGSINLWRLSGDGDRMSSR